MFFKIKKGIVMDVIAYFFLALICAFVTAYINRRKGRSAVAGVIVGLFFGPIGVILALLTSTNHDALETRSIDSGAGKKCPDCGELVRAEARICRHCRHTFAVKEGAV